MTTLETKLPAPSRIRHREIPLPPSELLPSAVIDKATAYADLLGRIKAARTRRSDLSYAYTAAAKEDQQARADALRAGQKDPGEKNKQNVIEEVSKVDDQISVLERAVADAGDELIAAAVAVRDEMVASVERDIAKATAHVYQLADQMDDAFAQIARLRALRWWAHDIDVSPRWRQQALKTDVGRLNGEQVTTSFLTSTLRGLVTELNGVGTNGGRTEIPGDA